MPLSKRVNTALNRNELACQKVFKHHSQYNYLYSEHVLCMYNVFFFKQRLGDDSIVSDHAPPKRSKTDSNATITGGISTATPSSTFRQPKPSTQSSTIEPRLRPPDIKPEPTTDKSSLSSKFLSSRYISESNQKPAEVNVSTQEKKKDVSNVYLHVQENSVKKEEIDENEEKMEVVEKEMEEEKSRKHKKKKKKKHKHEEKGTQIFIQYVTKKLSWKFQCKCNLQCTIYCQCLFGCALLTVYYIIILQTPSYLYLIPQKLWT